MVEIGDTVYHTEQISNAQTAAEGQASSVVFYVKTTGYGTQTVTLRSHWGTSSRYGAYEDQGDSDGLYIINGETVQLTLQGEAPAQPEQPVTTDPVTTDPVATEPAAPVTNEPASTEPASTESASTEPASTEPASTEPVTPEATPSEPQETTPATNE